MNITLQRLDGEWVATCPDYPSLSWIADTAQAALDGMKALLAEVQLDLT